MIWSLSIQEWINETNCNTCIHGIGCNWCTSSFVEGSIYLLERPINNWEPNVTMSSMTLNNWKITNVTMSSIALNRMHWCSSSKTGEIMDLKWPISFISIGSQEALKCNWMPMMHLLNWRNIVSNARTNLFFMKLTMSSIALNKMQLMQFLNNWRNHWFGVFPFKRELMKTIVTPAYIE